MNVHNSHEISKTVPLRFEDVGSSAGGDQRDRQDGDQLWRSKAQGDHYIYNKILVFAIGLFLNMCFNLYSKLRIIPFF